MAKRTIWRAVLPLCASIALACAPLTPRAAAQAMPETPVATQAATEPAAYRTLARGMAGEDVLHLKQRMQELGFFSADAALTDAYNVTMEYKVKQYQNKLGVQVTGIATPELQAMLFSENGGLPTPTPAPTELWVVLDGTAYRALRKNMAGEDVLRLKGRMQALGFFSPDAVLTDAYNVTMEYKVKQYQNALGVKATGIATPELQALIFTQDGGLPPPESPATQTAAATLPAAAGAATPAPLQSAPQAVAPSATPISPQSEAPSPQPTAPPAPSATPAPADVWETVAGTAYRSLQENMAGEDVLRLKARMQALGLFSATAALTDRYNVTMANKIKQYQHTLGLEATGIATPQLQALLYAPGGSLPTPTPVPTPDRVVIDGIAYRTLRRNHNGEDVLRFKLRLQALGYYPQNAEMTDLYNSTMEYKVKQYQNDLGVKATGIATPELQAGSLGAYGGLSTPVPPVMPSLPALTAEGFLAEAGAEYVYADVQQGLWIYLSPTLRVEVTRYTREGINPLIWFETSIRFTQGERFARFDALEKYQGRFNTEYPNTIAARNNLVLGFSDDFYGIRKHRKNKQGVIIRDGALIADDPYKKNVVTYLPPLDMIAFFPDGSMRALYGNEYTAEQLLGMGVDNTLSFGPVLLRGGELGQQVADGKYASNEPRCALGMIAPRHFLLMTVEGRHSASKGTGLAWLAMRMQELGVQEAVNLDGGNTTALVFRGELLNKIGTYDGKTITLRGVRSVSSIMGIGRNQSPLPVEDAQE